MSCGLTRAVVWSYGLERIREPLGLRAIPHRPHPILNLRIACCTGVFIVALSIPTHTYDGQRCIPCGLSDADMGRNISHLLMGVSGCGRRSCDELSRFSTIVGVIAVFRVSGVKVVSVHGKDATRGVPRKCIVRLSNKTPLNHKHRLWCQWFHSGVVSDGGGRAFAPVLEKIGSSIMAP